LSVVSNTFGHRGRQELIGGVVVSADKEAKTVDVRFVTLPGQDEDGEPEAPVEDDEVRTFPIKDIYLREEEVVEEQVAGLEDAGELTDDEDDASSIRTEDISSDEGETEEEEEEVELDVGMVPAQGVPALVAAALAVGDIDV
jgi:hypothetical protein